MRTETLLLRRQVQLQSPLQPLSQQQLPLCKSLQVTTQPRIRSRPHLLRQQRPARSRHHRQASPRRSSFRNFKIRSGTSDRQSELDNRIRSEIASSTINNKSSSITTRTSLCSSQKITFFTVVTPYKGLNRLEIAKMALFVARSDILFTILDSSKGNEDNGSAL